MPERTEQSARDRQSSVILVAAVPVLARVIAFGCIPGRFACHSVGCWLADAVDSRTIRHHQKVGYTRVAWKQSDAVAVRWLAFWSQDRVSPAWSSTFLDTAALMCDELQMRTGRTNGIGVTAVLCFAG